MQIHSIAELLGPVKTAGAMAVEEQRKAGYVRKTYKQDGSPVTEVDRKVEDYLLHETARRWPQANILTEETARPFDPTQPFTFALDPIDGTDVYSQGMASWCISVGLLDRDLNPIAGIVYAPRLDLLFFADIGKRANCPGHRIAVEHKPDPLSERSRLMVSSGIHRELDLVDFLGKAWGVGSAALHFCLPLICPDVVASIQHSGVYIWDLAGAHAINLSHGLELVLWSGEQINYADLVDERPVTDVTVSGSAQVIEKLRTSLPRR